MYFVLYGAPFLAKKCQLLSRQILEFLPKNIRIMFPSLLLHHMVGLLRCIPGSERSLLASFTVMLLFSLIILLMIIVIVLLFSLIILILIITLLFSLITLLLTWSCPCSLWPSWSWSMYPCSLWPSFLFSLISIPRSAPILFYHLDHDHFTPVLFDHLLCFLGMFSLLFYLYSLSCSCSLWSSSLTKAQSDNRPVSFLCTPSRHTYLCHLFWCGSFFALFSYFFYGWLQFHELRSLTVSPVYQICHLSVSVAPQWCAFYGTCPKSPQIGRDK